MRNLRKLLAALIVVTMIVSSLGAFAEEGSAAWTEETTADGWIKVTQENGPTLGYSPDSGVTILEVDGLAFKDMDKDGELDDYEDWRLSDDERAASLASMLDLDAQIGLMLYPDVFTIEEDASDAYDNSGRSIYELLDMGERSYLTFATSYPATTQAKWSNNAQAYAEALDYGIPMNLASNPQDFGSPGNLALGATFDTELANQIAQARAVVYRALGIATELGPQIEIASEPRWSRISGTYGEDPALNRDMANAVISGYQSTYDEEGNDLGWGEDSVIAMMKHFPGDGAGEGGRESHSTTGAYNVFPGDQFETGLIPFLDGGLNLDSVTGEAAAVMLNMSIAYSDDGSLGVLKATPFSEYKINILRENGYDGLICTDWLASTSAHGTADMTQNERQYAMIMAGVDQIGQDSNPDDYKVVYDMMVEEIGEEATAQRFEDSARRVLRTFFNADLFENPYVDSTAAQDIVDDADMLAMFEEANLKSVVMLKNENQAIKANDGEKPTVYIPMLYTPTEAGYMYATYASWDLPVDLKTAETYFNVITDTLGEPTGEPDEDGNPTYTKDDIIRASAEELAECDMALVIVNSPATDSGYDDETGEYIPITLQYREYTANSEGVRSESIAGDTIESQLETPYGTQTILEKENRSYYGKSATSNHESDLDAILYAAETMPEDASVVVAVNTSNPFCVYEFENQVDSILLGFGIDNDYFLEIAVGNYEPSGLLPFQMPADMEAVEAQLEDVPRDMECYVDANGNTYDFAFGMNWSGVIDDERVATYSVEPLVEPAMELVSE